MNRTSHFLLAALAALIYGLTLFAEPADRGGREVAEPHQREGCILPVSDEQQPLAALRDDWQDGRIQGSRPVRVLPSNASGRGRNAGKVHAPLKSNLQNLSVCHLTIRRMAISYRACASCDRYFIALRHIIR